jgi:hypothetical protein
MQVRVMTVSPDGGGIEAPLESKSLTGQEVSYWNVSSDARYVVAGFRNAGRGRIAVATFGPDGLLGEFAPILKEATESDIEEPEISPDGKLLAYVVRNADGREVFVTRFPNGIGRWQVSNVGGRLPRWARGSNELFYLANSGPIHVPWSRSRSTLTSTRQSAPARRYLNSTAKPPAHWIAAST